MSRLSAADPCGDLQSAYGAIAQLEERPVCIREVAGSSPAGSIEVSRRDPLKSQIV